jgi:Zn-dependent protease with chaperone function
MVDFFTRQERSRRNTRMLVVMFLAAVVAIVAAVTLVAAVLFGLFSDSPATGPGASPIGSAAAANLGPLAVIAAITAALIALASLYRAATLAAGGGQVARMLGGTQLSPDSTDPLHKRLINVTEEMAIASGVPVPEIFVLEHESAINGFAAGLTPSNAAIAVTRGALEQLDRTELQGVIAHEFSHILNGDMRINQQLIGLSYGILFLALIGRFILHGARFGRRGRQGRDAAAALAIGLGLVVIGSIGVFFSRLIKAAISRQRELLADASAVQFTRDPVGLAGALKKIGGYGSRLTSVNSEEIAHMLFARSSRAFSGLFATHPPLPERIRALDPTFRDSDFPQPGVPQRARAGAHAALAAGVVSAPASAVSAFAAAAAEPADAETGADTLLERAGEVGSPAAGSALRAALPDELYHAAHSRESSFLLALALAIAPDDAPRTRQLTMLESWLGRERTALTRRLRSDLDGVDATLRLPLLELAVPALRQRPAEQLEFLFDLIGRVTAITETTRLEDYVLVRALAAYLPEVKSAATIDARQLSERDALERVLAVVAAYGHVELASAQAAFATGLVVAAGLDRDAAVAVAGERLTGLDTLPDPATLDPALARLAMLAPEGKRRVLTAILATIRHDHRVEIAEIELFRTIAATLDCPLPPLAALGPAVDIR